MFIHIGNRKIISDKKFIGIFNANTLLKSECNDWIINNIPANQKSIAISDNNTLVSTEVNSITIIQRAGLLNNVDFVWRKKND